MKVSELIRLLNLFPEDSEVVIISYGRARLNPKIVLKGSNELIISNIEISNHIKNKMVIEEALEEYILMTGKQIKNARLDTGGNIELPQEESRKPSGISSKSRGETPCP